MPLAYVRRHPGRSLALLIICAWIFIPYYFLVVASFTPGGTTIQGFTPPPFTTLDNFAVVLAGSNVVWPSVAHSAVAAIGAVLIAVIAGTPAAYGLSRLRAGRAGHLVYLSFFVLRGVPPVALVLPYYLMFSRAHLLDTLHGLIIALVPIALPFTVWTMRVFFDALPNEVEDAARVDGANTLQRFFSIALPMVGPGVAATAVLAGLLVYVDYIFAATLTGPNSMTFSVYVTSFQQDYVTLVGPLSAAALLGTLPMVAMYTFAQRYMQRMAIAGAV